jgi:AraC-like DNA-binding protein
MFLPIFIEKISVYALFPMLTLLQAVIFSCIFIIRGRREERYSDFWLAAILLLNAWSGVPYMLGWLGITYLWEELTFYPWDGIGLALPPVIYFFIQSLTNYDWRFQWRRDGKFFIPYFVFFIYHFIVGAQGKSFAGWWWHEIDGKWYIFHTFEVIEILLQAICFWLAYRWYKEYQNWIKNNFSDTEKINYQWFKYFLIILATSIFIGYAMSVYLNFFPPAQDNWYQSLWWGYLTTTVLTYYISIEGLIQTRVHSVRFEQSDISIFPFLEKEEDPIVEKQELSEELLPYKEKVIALFDKDKLYLNCDLSLSELAQRLKTNTSILSQVINNGFGKNFNDFVNEYRVNSFKEKIQQSEYEHLTFLGIAFECGFNSKATFNRAFKKFTGLTPNDYVKNEKSN